MKRLLANTLMLAVGMSVSSQLLALGLGELTLHSALNQPLKAEIELVDHKGLTEWEIKSALASESDFDRAGVDRVFFLTRIQFTVDNGRIVLTSREPVNEPYLNFLVELNWPSGRVLREYTVLLDPPVFEETAIAPIVAAPASEAEFSEGSVSAPSAPARVNQWDTPAEVGTYKVQQDDTLWEIALKTRTDRSISAQQMMLAIQQQNPDAFIGGNINRLKSHHVLSIPDAEQVRAISMGQAVAEVARQNQALRAGVAQVDATGRAGQGAVQRADNTGGEVRLISNRSEESASAGSAGEVAQGVGSGRSAQLENELAIALENADKGRLENDELRNRLTALEEQINTLQRLISLKDDQLASLQVGETAAPAEQSVDFNYGGETAAVTTEEAPVDAAEADVAPAAVAADDDVQARRERLARLLAEEQAQQAAQTNVLDELLANPLIPAAAAGILLLAALLIVRAVKNKKENAVADEDDSLNADDIEMLGSVEGDAGSLDDFNFDDDELHSGVSNKKAVSDFDDFDDGHEHFDSDVQSGDALNVSDIHIVYGRFAEAIELLTSAIGEEPERTDLRLKLLEVYVELKDADSFARAEGELAQLGDANASEEARIMRQQLDFPKEPVFAGAAVATAFAATSAASADDDFGDLSDEFADGLDFGDALDMSSQSASVVELEKARPVAEEVPTLDLDEGMDFDFDDGELTQVAAKQESAPAASSDDDGLDFNLDDFGADEVTFDEPKAEPQVAAKAADDDGLDFDLDFGDSKEEPLVVAETEVADDLDALEFNVEPVAKTAAPAAPQVTSNTDELPDLAFELDDTGFAAEGGDDDLRALERELDSGAVTANDDLSFDLEADFGTEELAAEPVPTEAVLEVASDDDFNFDDVPALNEQADTEGEIDLEQLAAADDEFDFLAGTDECATKLDLARAYIDMEDIDGARELLQEVVQEGSDQQKADARELMNNLA